MITHGVVVVVQRWLLVLTLLCNGGIVSISGNKLDDVYKQLKQLNKPALKSIKSPDGDIIDCVHISHQPAFDHPLLKNHTIQMRPSYHPEGLFEENKESIPKSNEGISKSITQLWHLNGRCPEGTIPIRRTKKREILRASSIKSFGRKQHGTIPEPTMPTKPEPINLSAHQHATVVVQGDKYYGTKATVNVWKPIVQQSNEFSLSQLWIMAGSYPSDLNTIEAGWQRDAYQQTGCYNLRCPGFIQTSNKMAMGGTISPISAYDASQYEINFLVWKDTTRGEWWLQFGNEVVGYWPTSLFSYLHDGASQIQWGGEVLDYASGGQHTTTQMGSGHFPEEGFGKASYIKNIQIVDGSNKLIAPIGVSTLAEQPNCYNVQIGKNSDWGNYIYYGGPGRNPNCETTELIFYSLQCIL
ncbi:uncharacterized protein LOC114260887 isoform X2 [Camellia sinensis]|uniref:uncharacterized protein LOC114260887 isoform X2 n=1 Tax=Camellia sinensis TaxID=4442 RepID=UPI001036B461|nr:uncharacterized protein LOC114260887 isoform X2 [Camellia sinensis]